MIKTLIATKNKGKIKEINKILRNSKLKLKLYSLSDMKITDICDEDEETFHENANQKSIFYSRLIKNTLCVGDDSGLVVESLKGEPGVHSARYAGNDSDDEKNKKKLLKELENKNNRKAKFVTVLSISKNGKLIKSFQGEVEGIILRERRGNNGFGYDPLFFYPPLNKTFAELTTDQKNKISHRAIALKKMRDYIQNNIKKFI